MRTRRLGREGLRVSEMCLGTLTWGHQADEATSFRILDTVIENRMGLIDSDHPPQLREAVGSLAVALSGEARDACDAA